MRDGAIEYVHLPAGSPLPELAPVPCRVVVLVEQEVGAEWQDQVGDWLVEFGCLYMMAWGRNCSSWDDSVDWTNLRKYDFADISDDQFVMTTWHDDDLMIEVFEFSHLCAHHPTIELSTVRIVDISAFERRAEISSSYEHARDGLASESADEPTRDGLTG